MCMETNKKIVRGLCDIVVLFGLPIFAGIIPPISQGHIILKVAIGISAMILIMWGRLQKFGYRGISTVMVFLFSVFSCLLVFWLIPVGIVPKSSLWYMTVIELLVLLWDGSRAVREIDIKLFEKSKSSKQNK